MESTLSPPSKLALLFPGQGSQYAGMGRELCESFPAARAVFQEADDALGFPLSRLCFEGPAEELQLTANTQPAILACSVAAYRVLAERLGEVSYVAGHSLGEYSALVAAGSLAFADGVRTVRKRGQYMQSAVPVGAGAMAALVGLALERVEAICREVAQGQVVSPANINTPEQVVLAGHAAAVKRAMEKALEAGAKRAVELAVSAPFHCSLMMPAQRQLAPELAATEFRDLAMPLINNVRAEEVRVGEQARHGLIDQIPAPVLWERSVRKAIGFGVVRFIEVGPGRVLSGLLRQIDRSVAATNVEDNKSLEKTLSWLQAGADVERTS